MTRFLFLPFLMSFKTSKGVLDLIFSSSDLTAEVPLLDGVLKPDAEGLVVLALLLVLTGRLP